MSDIEKIEEMVRSFVKERMRDVRLVSINVAPAHDKDGRRVFHIHVIFDGKHESLNSRETMGLVRSMAPRMEQELDEPGFPLLWFIAEKEYKERKAAS
jgi:hypothetical protein